MNVQQQAALTAIDTARSQTAAVIDADNAAYAALVADKVALQAAFDAYKVSHPDVQPVKTFSFGLTVGANDARLPSTISGGSLAALQWAYDKARAAQGKDLGLGLKVFGTTGIATAGAKWTGLKHGTEGRPVLTDEVHSPTAFGTFMDTLTYQFDYVIAQEFMDKMQPYNASGFTPDQFTGWLNDLRAQIDAHKNGHLVNLRIVGNEAVERKQAAAGLPAIWTLIVDKLPPRIIIGNDTYITQSAMLDPAKGAKGTIDFFNAAKQTVAGVECGISEMGISAVNFTPTQRSDAFKAYHDKFLALGARSFNVWVTNNSDVSPEKDWSADTAAQAAVAQTLASLTGTVNL